MNLPAPLHVPWHRAHCSFGGCSCRSAPVDRLTLFNSEDADLKLLFEFGNFADQIFHGVFECSGRCLLSIRLDLDIHHTEKSEISSFMHFSHFDVDIVLQRMRLSISGEDDMVILQQLPKDGAPRHLDVTSVVDRRVYILIRFPRVWVSLSMTNVAVLETLSSLMHSTLPQQEDGGQKVQRDRRATFVCRREGRTSRIVQADSSSNDSERYAHRIVVPLTVTS